MLYAIAMEQITNLQHRDKSIPRVNVGLIHLMYMYIFSSRTYLTVILYDIQILNLQLKAGQ